MYNRKEAAGGTRQRKEKPRTEFLKTCTVMPNAVFAKRSHGHMFTTQKTERDFSKFRALFIRLLLLRPPTTHHTSHISRPAYRHTLAGSSLLNNKNISTRDTQREKLIDQAAYFIHLTVRGGVQEKKQFPSCCVCFLTDFFLGRFSPSFHYPPYSLLSGCTAI